MTTLTGVRDLSSEWVTVIEKPKALQESLPDRTIQEDPNVTGPQSGIIADVGATGEGVVETELHQTDWIEVGEAEETQERRFEYVVDARRAFVAVTAFGAIFLLSAVAYVSAMAGKPALFPLPLSFLVTLGGGVMLATSMVALWDALWGAGRGRV